MGSRIIQKPALDSEGRFRQAPEPRKDGSGLVVVTYNWCDKCTWYQGSTRKTGHALTLDTGLVYDSGIQNWIDLTHGRLYREDLVSADYLVKVYDGATELTERTPFADSGGDYVVDYKTGKVTLAQAPSGAVTDIDLTDTIHFQAWAYNPEDLPNKIAVTAKTTYKTVGDFVDEARGVYPQIPAFGGSSRGLTQPTLNFPFKYMQLKELFYSQGLEIRVWLENDTEFAGERATATFYCSSYDE